MTTIAHNTDIHTAKFYSIIRSAHLERSLNSNNSWILYSKTNYDLDAQLLENNELAVKMSPWMLPRFVKRSDIRILEVNEPLMLPAWRVLIPILLLCILHPAMRKLRIVFYAIENLDPSPNLAARLHLPTQVAKGITSLACRVAFLVADRVAFGTQGSMGLYASLLGSHWKKARLQAKVRQIDPLPSAELIEAEQKVPGSVLFLGDLSARKGIDRLIDAWDTLPPNHGLTLCIIGMGEELERVKLWARDRPEVTLKVSPSRVVIRETLAKSETLVLLSSTSTIWREQIGLPLLEGWSYGCNLITTDATGIADLLRRSGHTVLPELFTTNTLTDALLGNLLPRRSADAVQEDLPEVDGRLEADLWLNEYTFSTKSKSGIQL
ncbi:glycosyltransferase involved in cell wall biosynthesis [Arthrobacter sp. PvP102]|uniref:glycosyltransferase n=1 Tax=unclassified Arthrobacter TaxID=235627 RepID=UPI001AE12606|nr:MULTISPECIES: glycosyltransferase [unclassified Arthrobacter]MBP1232516.1 glycosyltransferase involved in cell wall biosynthesis [Arthrobacter sp. PvP103]MBP1237651.1 glycosyltransferase involved in cell wall biosynthesis [Arthrobacter sp. PvP102]